MAVESAADLAGMLEDFGEEATLSLAAAGGQVVRVKAIVMGPEAGASAGRIVARSVSAQIQAAAIPARPRSGDRLTVGGNVWTVAAVESDGSGAVLSLTLAK